MEDILGGIAGFAGIARDAVAAAFVAAGAPAAVADIAATALFTLIMAAMYFGIAGGLLLRCRRRAAEAEAAERDGVPIPDESRPWSECFPAGWDADAASWLIHRAPCARVFEAAILRLDREGVLKIEQAPFEEGGMRFALKGLPRDADVIGIAAIDLLFLNAPRRVTAFEALEDEEWGLSVQGTIIEHFIGAPQKVCEQSGLSFAVDKQAGTTLEYQSVVFVLVGLIGAIWFSSAVPELVTIAIYITSSVLFARTQLALRQRELTPAGARVAARMDALKHRIGRCLREDERLGDGSVSAREIMEYAVVFGFSDHELAQLATRSGSTSLDRLFCARSIEDGLIAGNRGVKASFKKLKRGVGRGSNLSWAARIRAIGQNAIAWYDYETAPSD